MKSQIAIVCRCILAFMLVWAMTDSAEAGPLGFKVTKAETGGISAGKQTIIIHYTVKNTSHVEFFNRLNNITVEITGDIGNGRRETYQKKVDVNYFFEPVLGPGSSKKLKTQFARKINPGKGWHPYRHVRVRILKYNAPRAS